MDCTRRSRSMTFNIIGIRKTTYRKRDKDAQMFITIWNGNVEDDNLKAGQSFDINPQVSEDCRPGERCKNPGSI